MDFGDFRKIADTANFIIVQPQATGDVPSWDLTGTTDTDFLMALLDQLESEYKIDTNRVYSTGFSQGGMMSYLFACFHSTRIAAVAPVAGGMSSTTVTDCKPTHYMPLMEVHGTTDQLAAYTGSAASPGVQTLLNYWVKVNKCTPTAVKTTLPNTNTGDACTVEHYVYGGGMDNANVEHYKVIDGGHEWPTLTPGKFNYGLGNRNLDYDASKEIWRFFSSYSLDKLSSTGISEMDAVENSVSISPNPSNGVFTLKTNSYTNGKLIITDVVGKVVFETNLKAELTSIDIKNVGKGIYIYQVREQSGTTSSGKIIIE
jgi:polyhydroxybutyrate depolymerase